MIVRWGLHELPAVLAELGIERPLLVASPRWSDVDLGVRFAGRWTEVPSERVAEAAAQAGDGVVALGGVGRRERSPGLYADDVCRGRVDAVLRHP